jgi:hypothetical protein
VYTQRISWFRGSNLWIAQVPFGDELTMALFRKSQNRPISRLFAIVWMPARHTGFGTTDAIDVTGRPILFSAVEEGARSRAHIGHCTALMEDSGGFGGVDCRGWNNSLLCDGLVGEACLQRHHSALDLYGNRDVWCDNNSHRAAQYEQPAVRGISPYSRTCVLIAFKLGATLAHVPQGRLV